MVKVELVPTDGAAPIEARNVVVVSDPTIKAVTPDVTRLVASGVSELATDVQVTAAGITSPARPPGDEFVYRRPATTSLDPEVSSPVGGGQITVNGSGFGPEGTADSVLFCPSAARQVSCVKADDVVVDNDALITAKIPPESSYIKATHGAGGVIVSVPPGVSNAPNFVAFNYR